MTRAPDHPPHHVDLASDYFDLCLRATKEFLHTIVVVDDRATYGDPEMVTVLAPPSGADLPEGEFTEELADFGTGSGSSLDVSTLTGASADLGLTCAVLRPREDEQHDGTLDQRLVNVASRADVLVLDWQLNDEPGGEGALRLLQEIIEDDQKSPARLRLICIYTGEPNLDRIHEAIKKRLASESWIFSEAGAEDRWMSCGFLRVVIIPKIGNLGSKEGSIDEGRLPARLLEEFTQLTAGLVSNLAVAALASVRRHAHRLLTRFNSRLDPAFLSHRFFAGGAESEELLVRLVADEIKSVLDGVDVRRWVGPSAVELWGTEHLPNETALPGKTARYVSKATLLDVIAGDDFYGVKDVTDSRNHGDSFNIGKNRTTITGLLTESEADPSDLDYEFSKLTCLARNDSFPFPGTSTPSLTEGTVIRGRNGPEKIYLLCAMPLCDTVRLANKVRSFPFVPLKLASADSRYNLVAHGPEGERLYLAFSPDNHYDLVRQQFTGDTSGSVRAKRSFFRKDGTEYERFVFYDANGRPWIWIAELRFQHAHRRLNELGAASSRVGLDESHVLRMAARP